MHVPERRWNPYAWAMAKSEFRKRLELACRGILIPVDEVKPIERGRSEKLFEIKWTVPVQDGLEGGSFRFHDVQVRAYHSEPVELPFGFVGLHVHEKRIVDGNDAATRDLQNVEKDHLLHHSKGLDPRRKFRHVAASRICPRRRYAGDAP